MSNEAEWCLAGDRDVSEAVSAEEDTPNKHLQNRPLEPD
jgi:hypothetical protein